MKSEETGARSRWDDPFYNQTPLTRFAATVARLAGVEAPACAAEPIEWVCDQLTAICRDRIDRVFIHNPDAVGMWLYQKYPDAFEVVLKHVQVTLPMRTAMPSITPVCFATMYTGAEPEVHGILERKKPMEPVQVDTLFEAMIRAGKKVALVSVSTASMSQLFLGKGMDIYNCEDEPAVVAKAQELILQDEYDMICVYTYMYDNMDHIYGPEGKEALEALYNQGKHFDKMVTLIKQQWKDHNTLISFSTDHGVHAFENPHELYKGKWLKVGGHGTDSPLDINVLHGIGVICASK